MALLSANMALCEAVIWEDPPAASGGGKIGTIVRALSVITLRNTFSAHFFCVTGLASQPGDFNPHVLRIQITDKTGSVISQTEGYKFSYGYLIDSHAFGGFTLTTEFTIDVSQYQLPLGCVVTAHLDDVAIARTPLLIKRL
jgi:hypothetical protein